MAIIEISRRDLFTKGSAVFAGILFPFNTLNASQKDEVTKLIFVEPGIYTIQDTIRINESNIQVIGVPGVIIKLADHVNKPVIAIGSQDNPPNRLIENISITGLKIDGNKDNQDQEYDVSRSWIRNNGIDIRKVRRLTIDNVVVHDARSGGLVISQDSSDIHVINSSFNSNFFDGIAYYTSKRIYTHNCSMLSNNNAAISLDNDLEDSIFSDCIADSNGDVGIFMRCGKEVRFNHCVIKNSGSYAAFLSHDEHGNGVHDVMISGCQILHNKNGGIYVASTKDKSDYTSVVGCVFRGNEGETIRSDGSIIWENANISMQ